MKEFFIKVLEFPNYSVSNLGNIKNDSTGRLLKPWNNGNGYMCTHFYKDGKLTARSIHRLVLKAFCPRPDQDDLEVNHKDLNKSNNALENLEWNTKKQNIQHAIENGAFINVGLLSSKRSKGEGNPKVKLTDEQVLEIRESYKTSPELSIIYNVTSSIISRIRQGKLWKHLLPKNYINKNPLAKPCRIKK